METNSTTICLFPLASEFDMAPLTQDFPSLASPPVTHLGNLKYILRSLKNVRHSTLSILRTSQALNNVPLDRSSEDRVFDEEDGCPLSPYVLF